MRVIVWGINYAPEPAGIGPYNTALCEFLARRGHDVEMVTTFEYYPTWEKKPEDRSCAFRDEERAGVKVHRCWHYVPKKVNTLKRMVHELSFVLSSFMMVLRLQRPHVFVIISPPLLLGAAGAVAGFFKRAPFVFHVQDLQPDAAVRLGMLKANRWVDRLMTRILYGLESVSYSCASRVSSISAGILRIMRGKKVPGDKLLYFPNGVRFPGALPAKGRFRERYGIPAETFIVLYSGNLGMKQGLDALIDAACFLRQQSQEDSREGVREVKFVIAGAGASRGRLQQRLEREKLANVLLLPLQPEPAYHEMLVDADCCAITQEPGTGALFFPSKLLTALAFAKPILSIADEDGDLAAAVASGGFGVNVRPGFPLRVAEAVRNWTLPAADLETLGCQGRQFVARFNMDDVLGQFEGELRRMACPSEPHPPHELSTPVPISTPKSEQFP
jgi:colanic acid biosynthesis glycosyl transferase WcaI